MSFLSFQIELFVEHLQASTVNDKIFPNIVSGFMDTNPVVRESTIKVGVSCIRYEPRCEKTGLRGFKQGLTQTGLYSRRK